MEVANLQSHNPTGIKKENNREQPSSVMDTNSVQSRNPMKVKNESNAELKLENETRTFLHSTPQFESKSFHKESEGDKLALDSDQMVTETSLFIPPEKSLKPQKSKSSGRTPAQISMAIDLRLKKQSEKKRKQEEDACANNEGGGQQKRAKKDVRQIKDTKSILHQLISQTEIAPTAGIFNQYPDASGSTRSEYFKMLKANCPQGFDRKTLNVDLKTLRTSITRFGHHMTRDGHNWKLKDLKCRKYPILTSFLSLTNDASTIRASSNWGSRYASFGNFERSTRWSFWGHPRR
jgi:hypothetical protein